ncbi:TNF receptor-associated factor 2-like isoform X2 [Ptychodera flava]|uniref:TNF receptor-associated factor 2-like isoform X2 n=1 Tax=Ptychodera flava TaxID=63121 RepID=UPI00396A0B69
MKATNKSRYVSIPQRRTVSVLGYSKLYLKIPEGDELKYKCIDCKFFLRNPYQSICGHRFCYSCVENLTSKKTITVCPQCSVDDPSLATESIIVSLSTINPDYAIKREMKTLPAKCINCGCDWTGYFEKYTKHESECRHAEVTCSNEGCLEVIKRCDLENHLTYYCPMRSVVCEHCKSQILFKDTKDHEEVQCSRVPVTCRLCSRKFLRTSLTSTLIQVLETVRGRDIGVNFTRSAVMKRCVRCFHLKLATGDIGRL